MVPSKSQIIAALPKLSADDLAEVGAVVRHLAGQGTKGTPVIALKPLYDALAATLGISEPYAAFARTGAYRQWLEYAPILDRFTEECFPDTRGSKVLKNAVLRFLFKIEESQLKERGVPVCITTMVRDFPKIPDMFDMAFPSYRAMQMCGLITMRLKASK